MKNKWLCYFMMSITWFIGYYACIIFLELCIDMLNFLAQNDFYNTKRFATFKVSKLFILLNPFCICCYYKFACVRKFNIYTPILFSIIVAFLFLGLYIVWFKFGGFNPSHKVYLVSLAFLMSILAYFKTYFIYQNKTLEFATLSVSEFAFIVVVGIFLQ